MEGIGVRRGIRAADRQTTGQIFDRVGRLEEVFNRVRGSSGREDEGKERTEEKRSILGKRY